MWEARLPPQHRAPASGTTCHSEHPTPCLGAPASCCKVAAAQLVAWPSPLLFPPSTGPAHTPGSQKDLTHYTSPRLSREEGGCGDRGPSSLGHVLKETVNQCPTQVSPTAHCTGSCTRAGTHSFPAGGPWGARAGPSPVGGKHALAQQRRCCL